VLDLMIILIFLIGLISRITMIIVPSEKSDESENPEPQCDVVYTTMDDTDAHGNVFGHSACWG